MDMQRKEILCFGDSNTYGLIPGTTERYGYGVRWTSLLEEAVWEKGYYVSEEGLCGRTTIFDDPLRDGRRGTELLPTLLETHQPIEVVTVMLGTNDCKMIYDASAEIIGKGIERLLDQIGHVAPQAKVLLIAPIALGDGVGEEGYDPEFNQESVEVSKSLPEVYRKIAAKRNLFFLAASDYASPSERDREHLDEVGHEKLGTAIYQKLLTEVF